MVVTQRVEGLAEPDEIDRDQLGALVDELVEAVLAVGARLTPVHRAGLVVDLARPSRVTCLPLDSMVSCCR